MTLTFGNYKFNKRAIAVLRKIKGRKEGFIDYNEYNLKKSVFQEIPKMIKAGVLTAMTEKGCSRYYILTVEMEKHIENIDIFALKPYPKKINKNAIEALTLIGNHSYTLFNDMKETSCRFDFMKNEIRNFPTIFKEILYPNDLVSLYRVTRNGIEESSIFSIYGADYYVNGDAGRNHINDYLVIKDKGLKLLEDNGIFLYYFEDNICNIDISEDMKYLEENLFEDFESIKIIGIKYNKNNDYIIEAHSNIKEHIPIMKKYRKSEIRDKIKISFNF